MEEPGTGRLFEAVTPEAKRRLLGAAAELFSAEGFHATRTRDITQRAGLSPAALYIHYRSKGDVLAAIVSLAHRSILDVLRDALAGLPDDAEERVRALVAAFVRWQAEHVHVARIAVQNVGPVPDRQSPGIAQLRRAVEGMFEAELRAGLRRRDFHVSDVHHSLLALVSLGMDVARWYEPDSAASTPAALAELYAELAVRMVRRPVGG